VINILVVEDDANKISELLSLLGSFPEIKLDDVIRANDAVSARSHLCDKQFDLIILDINLPERFGDTTQRDGGLALLLELSKSKRLKRPHHIIGVTSYDDVAEEVRSEFEKEMTHLIHRTMSGGWTSQLRQKVFTILQSSILSATSSLEYNYDIAIITALHEPELSSILNLSCDWQKIDIADDASHYYEGIIQNGTKKLRVVASSANQMGMTATAILSMKMIDLYRPKYLVMCGIAAGVKGEAKLCDILFADSSWDYGSGKIKEQKGSRNFLPDPKVIPVDVDLKEHALTCKLEKKYVSDILKSWPGDPPPNAVDLVIGPVLSGAAVVQSQAFIEELKRQSRKVVGIEMESYAVFYAAANCRKPRPRAISIKAVCDFGNLRKNNKQQRLCAYLSAQFFKSFALDYF